MKSSTRNYLTIGFAAFGILAVGGGIGLAWHLREHQDAYFTDADTIDRHADRTSPRDILWREPIDLPRVINTATDEYAPSLSPDGLAIYFARAGGDGGGADLYVSIKTPTGWSEPAVLPINSRGGDIDPVVSADGRTLYFSSNRPGGHGDYDLWAAHRPVDAAPAAARSWGPPINLGPLVNSRGNDYGPAPTPDGAMLYFASDRAVETDDATRATGASVSGVAHPDFDIYALDLTVDDATPVPIEVLNTPYNETAPAVSPANDFVYFASDRPGGAGGFDLYRSRRLHQAHLPPVNLGDAVNTDAAELDPAVSLGGFGLHFAAGEAGGDYDLRYTVSREVFKRSEIYRADLDWNALGARLWPYLVWLLGAILLLILLAGLLKRMEYRKLSLLARCLMVSLMIHMLMMIGFAFWGVSTVLSEWVQPGRGMRVVLTSSSSGVGLAAQLRGTIAPPVLDAPWPVATDRSEHATDPMPVPRAQVEVPTTPVEAGDLEAAATEPLVTATAQDAASARPRPPEPSSAISKANPVALSVPAQGDRTSESEASPAIRTASVERPSAARTRTRVSASSAPSPAVPAAVPLAQSRLESSAEPTVTATREAPASSVPAPSAPTALPDLGELEPVPVDGPLDRSHVRRAEASGSIKTASVASEHATRTEPVMASPDAGPLLPATMVMMSAAAVALSADAQPWAATSVRRDRAPDPPTMTSAVADRSGSTTGSIDFALPALPGLEQQPGGRPDESVERSPDVGSIARRADTASAPFAAAMPAIDPGDVHAAARINPDTAPARYASSSLAPIASRDASPRRAPTSNSNFAAATVDRPDRMTLGLPRLEGSSVVSEPERSSRAVSVPHASTQRRWTPPTEAGSRTAHLGRSLQHTADAGPVTVASGDPAAPPRMDIRSSRLEIELSAAPVLVSLDLDLKVPTRTAPLPDPYRHREPEAREEVLEEMGGSVETELAVANALEWLARHQSADGRWDGEHFDDRCGHCSGTQRVKCDIALTGLSVLCFVAADHTHLKDGPYRRTVDRGLRWLLERQTSDGNLMDGESLYSHGIATIALAEAYGMTHDPRLVGPVKAAVAFICDERNMRAGGWRYRPGQAGDTSVMGWQIMALTSARRSGIDVPQRPFVIADRWLDSVYRPLRPGTYAYQPRREVTPAMTAEGMFVRQLLGADPDDPHMQASARYIIKNLPTWRPDANTYYWYYATLALFQHQGAEWQQWNEAIKLLLVAHQRDSGPTAGSWDPDGRWAGVAGRVYQTAVATLTLEVYYRYLPLYVREP